MVTEQGIKSVSKYYLSVAEGILRRWGTESPTQEEIYQANLRAAKGISDLTPEIIYALINSGLLNDIIVEYAVRGAKIANCVNTADICALRNGVRAALDDLLAEELDREE